MIRHHFPSLEDKKQNKFEIDEKKLVKTFIYFNQKEWIEYFTGFLFIDPSHEGSVNLKIRFSRHPHLIQIEGGVKFPLELYTDDQGLYTLIHERNIKTVQKPEQNLLYLKIGPQERILAISFYSKSYCKALLEHLTLVLENNDSDEMTWTQQNLQFLNASMKQNLMYVDSVFILEERIIDFLNFFNKMDKRLYLHEQKIQNSNEQKYMVQFFQIVKNVFIRGNDKIIMNFIDSRYNFETVLKCLSYNPFGVCHFNYLEEFNKTTIINSSIVEFEDKDFFSKYELILKIKFLKDVAICTFIELSTEAVFNEFLNKAYVQILQILGNSKNCLIEKLQQLSRKDEYKFICIFCQIWEIFRAIYEDSQTINIKEIFYLSWIQNGMFSLTLSTIGRFVRQREVSDIHPRFWQRWLEAMNSMLSYEWNQSQKMILHHKNFLNSEDTMDLMSTLVMVFANCDENSKTLILDFVKVQIEVSENRKHTTGKYMSYIYSHFICKSHEYCNNEENIEKYIQFIRKLYIAEPIRTRHFIVQSNFMSILKHYAPNKFIFIMLLKLLKTFIEVADNDTFRYLDLTNLYDCFREKYAQNKYLKNITSSLFLAIFKATQNIVNIEAKKYLYKIFYSSDFEIRADMLKETIISKGNEQKSSKRPVPINGFINEMEAQI